MFHLSLNSHLVLQQAGASGRLSHRTYRVTNTQKPPQQTNRTVHYSWENILLLVWCSQCIWTVRFCAFPGGNRLGRKKSRARRAKGAPDLTTVRIPHGQTFVK